MGKSKGKSNLENLHTNGNTKMDLQEVGLGVWTGLIGLWAGTGGGLV